MLPAALAVAGGALLTASLDVAGLRVGATPAELLLWGALGVLFAQAFSVGALVLAVPVLLAGIELASGAGGPASAAAAGDPFTLAFPAGHRLEVTQVVFAAAYATWARHFDLRTGITWAGLAAVLAASLARDGNLLAVTLLGLALLLPNLDRLAGLLREDED